jgi:hypothetical protein
MQLLKGIFFVKSAIYRFIDLLYYYNTYSLYITNSLCGAECLDY